MRCIEYRVLSIRMGRPPLGPAKRSKHIALHVTEAQHAQITARGGTEWVRRTVLAALSPTRAPEPVQKPAKTRRKPEPTPNRIDGLPSHRHKRERVGPKWVGGQDVGEWKCADPDCGVTLGILQ